jgi:hypothetical protein
VTKRQPPKRFSMYRVIHSDAEGFDVGALLVDKGNTLVTAWNVLDTKTGKVTGATGKRVGLACPTCRVEHSRVTALDHPCDHGPDVPPLKPNDEETP